MGKIDFIRAKARFAIDINAYFSHLCDFPVCEWKNAVHPLLYISHRNQKKNVVPLDLSLSQQQRILIISGPNAGGKSVALKTAGLLQYMLQCGLLIPVDEKMGDAEKAAQKAKAEAILVKAGAQGADFAALAKEFSSCPSKENGGDLATSQEERW